MIEAAGLSKRYGAIRAVDRVSFVGRRGDVLVFLGPKGAGKATTMKLLTGYLRPDAGAVRVEGIDVATDPVAARRSLGYLPENCPLYPEMTVGEFLRFIARARDLRGPSAAAAVDRVVSAVGLSAVYSQTVETLSKGFRQRVGFAQALLHDPRGLILDEPTDGLDPVQKHEVRSLIRGMAGEKAVIISTHLLDEAEAVCNRIIVIAGGRIVADETPEQFRARDPGAPLEGIFRRLVASRTDAFPPCAR